MPLIVHALWLAPAVVTLRVVGLEEHHVVDQLAPLDAVRLSASARDEDNEDSAINWARVRLVEQYRVAGMDARLHAVALAVHHPGCAG